MSDYPEGTRTDVAGHKREVEHFPAHPPRIKAAKEAPSVHADGRTGAGR